jgi:phage tail-like protein
VPNELIASDPIVAQNFFLEIDGQVVTVLSSVSGLDVEVDVATISQVGPSGKTEMVKTLGTQTKAPDLTLTRMAPPDSTQDAMWAWFNDVRDKGFALSDRAQPRKNGSVVLYDSANTEIARFNFYRGWPSKIATDQLSVDSSDIVKENITLTIERLERVK